MYAASVFLSHIKTLIKHGFLLSDLRELLMFFGIYTKFIYLPTFIATFYWHIARILKEKSHAVGSTKRGNIYRRAISPLPQFFHLFPRSQLIALLLIYYYYYYCYYYYYYINIIIIINPPSRKKSIGLLPKIAKGWRHYWSRMPINVKL